MDPQSPYQILVLGDFGGRGVRSSQGSQVGPEAGAGLARRRAILVDRERLDAAMARLGIHCEVALGDDGGSTVSLHFASVDDFHPDRLAQTVPPLAELLRIRQGLQSPATFEKAAAEVRSWGIVHPKTEAISPRTEQAPGPARPVEPAAGESVLDMVLGQASSPSESSEPAPLPRELADLVRRTAEPYRVAKPHPEQADLVGCVDAVASRLLRTVLHDPGFQALEAAWRGLAFLARRLPTVIAGSPYEGIRLPAVDRDHSAACRHAASKSVRAVRAAAVAEVPPLAGAAAPGSRLGARGLADNRRHLAHQPLP